MVRQLPTPVASAWLFDLGELRGPWLVVLRDIELEARSRLAEHLFEVGATDDLGSAMDIAVRAPAEPAGVVW